MKKFIILLIIIFCSCSNSSETNTDQESQNGVITLQINNVYLEGDCTNSDNYCEPRDVIVTDGAFNKSPEDDLYYPDDNTTYFVVFLYLQDGESSTSNIFSTPNIFEQLYNPDLHLYENQGLEGIIFYTDIVIENGNYISSTDLTETEGYVRFTVNSENNFDFYFELIDGRKFQGSYSGNINIIDWNYGCVPCVYWDN